MINHISFPFFSFGQLLPVGRDRVQYFVNHPVRALHLLIIQSNLDY